MWKIRDCCGLPAVCWLPLKIPKSGFKLIGRGPQGSWIWLSKLEPFDFRRPWNLFSGKLWNFAAGNIWNLASCSLWNLPFGTISRREPGEPCKWEPCNLATGKPWNLASGDLSNFAVGNLRTPLEPFRVRNLLKRTFAALLFGTGTFGPFCGNLWNLMEGKPLERFGFGNLGGLPVEAYRTIWHWKLRNFASTNCATLLLGTSERLLVASFATLPHVATETLGTLPLGLQFCFWTRWNIFALGTFGTLLARALPLCYGEPFEPCLWQSLQL